MSTSSPSSDFCPYLGLHDDPRTSLAYPSAWNYCYRARPPASIRLSHQSAACLCKKHRECPVYLAEQGRALPPDLRGSGKTPAGHESRPARKARSAVWFVLFLAVMAAVWWVWGRQFILSAATPAPASLSTASASPTAASQIAWVNPALAAATGSPQPAPRASRTPLGTALPSATFTAASVRSPTPTTTATPTAPPTLPPGTCGHLLDEPFGTQVRFVIHRVEAGDSTDLISSRYQTSLDAIQAVNVSLHLPLWSDAILVIPVGITDTRGIPAFEPYQAFGEKLSLEELALRLNADPQALKLYNAFDDGCTTFLNWLLIPRARPSG